MKFSAFTKFGHLRFSGKPARGEVFYRQLTNTLGDGFASELGTAVEAQKFALSMAMARAAGTIERAANQKYPRRCIEMLPVLERVYGVHPGVNETIGERQTAIAAKMARTRGASYGDITTALSEALGPDFVAYRQTTQAEAHEHPADPATGAIWQAPRLRSKIFTLDQYALTGVHTVAYSAVESGQAVELGDQLMVSPENQATLERVTATASTASTFTASFTRTHEAGATAISGWFPYDLSTVRHVLIIITRAAAEDARKRRLVNEVMRRIVRATMTWDIAPVSGLGDGMTAAFTTNDAVLGRTGYAITDGLAY